MCIILKVAYVDAQAMYVQSIYVVLYTVPYHDFHMHVYNVQVHIAM